MLSHITNRHRCSYVNIINPTYEEKKLKSNSILRRCFSVNDGKVIKWVNQISDVTKDIKINENQNSNKSKSTIKFDLSHSELNHQQKQKLQPFLNKNRDVFATNLSEMGHTTLLKYEILTGNSPPVQCRPYQTSPKMKAEIERQFDEMLKYGIIEESVSNNSSPIVMVKRKTTLDTKNPDYRGLNSRTETQKIPTP